MRAVIDTNIFVYATYSSFAEHQRALDFLRACRKGTDSYAVTWGIVYEYLRVVTHPQVFPHGAIPFEKAAENVARFTQSARCEILMETPDHWSMLKQVVRDAGRSRGNVLHDCHIAALMREHDMKRIYTADTDFRLFKGIEPVNPLQ